MNPVVRKKLSSKEWAELEKYVKFFTFKVSQVIVQARFGEKSYEISRQPSKRAWFNLVIEDNSEIQSKVKEAYSNVSPTLKDFCICTEILLKTSDGDTLVLETWSVSLNTSECFLDSPYVSYTSLASVYCRMTLLLKSIISMTRTTPAYKLSSCQSPDTHVILFRIYSGEPQLDLLGENNVCCKVGQVLTSVGTLQVSLWYRSKDNMAITPERVVKGSPLFLKSDYFKPDKSPKASFEEYQPEIKSTLVNNPNELRRMGAFGYPGSLPDTFPALDLLEKPFLNLSRCKLCENPHGEKHKLDAYKKDDKNENLNKHTKPCSYGLDYNCNTNENCEKYNRERNSKPEDFVSIEIKPPFADREGKNDIGTFFRECQSAPPLASFSLQPTFEEQVTDITCQLMKFETSMNDFDDFVDSICLFNVSK